MNLARYILLLFVIFSSSNVLAQDGNSQNDAPAEVPETQEPVNNQVPVSPQADKVPINNPDPPAEKEPVNDPVDPNQNGKTPVRPVISPFFNWYRPLRSIQNYFQG